MKKTIADRQEQNEKRQKIEVSDGVVVDDDDDTCTAIVANDDMDDAASSLNTTTAATVTSTTTQYHHFGMSDDEFCAYMAEQLQQHPLAHDFPQLFEKAPRCMTQWRKRFRNNPPLWRRLFDKDRVMKEFIEAVPVLDAVVRLIAANDAATDKQQQYTIVDLCSGKGYLSMLLSELLPPQKIFRIVLMDKAFAMRNQQPQSHHINWEHIYGEQPPQPRPDSENDAAAAATATTSTSSPSATYYDTWPISLDASKQDLKASRQLKAIPQHWFSQDRPAIVLAIHLCGILSLRAIQLFNDNPETVQFLALKPCCLPGMIHVKRHEVFQVGNHSFDAAEVCVHGKWKQNKWVGGPPRKHIQSKFQVWAQHLYRGIAVVDEQNQEFDNDNDDDDGGKCDGDNKKKPKDESGDIAGTTSTTKENSDTGRKLHCRVMVQQGGGFQNDFLFAQRTPMTDSVWEQLQCHQVRDTDATDANTSLNET